MPMWIVPDHKVTLQELQERMRDHYEDTPFAMTEDPGAGAFNAPVRFRPMKYEVDGKQYTHERPTATMQTAWSFIAQCRSKYTEQHRCNDRCFFGKARKEQVVHYYE